jgi:hypothetical protein
MVFIEKGAGVPGAPKTAAASAQNDDDEDSRFNR